MNDDILSLLKVHDYFRGIPDQAMQEVLQDAPLSASPSNGRRRYSRSSTIPPTCRVAERLAGRLLEVGEKVRAFSDADDWRDLGQVPQRRLHVDGKMLELDGVRRQVAE
jgi:hypothetical protein